MKLEIKIDDAKVRQEIKSMSAAAQKAMVSTINKVAAKMRAEGSREVRKEYKVKPADINKALWLKRATPGNLKAILRARGRRTPLFVFSARQNSRDVTVQVKVNRGRTLLLSSFEATVGTGGHVGVFWRKERFRRGQRVPRLPIKELFGPSIPQLFGSEAIARKLEALVDRDLPKVFSHELAFYQGRG